MRPAIAVVVLAAVLGCGEEKDADERAQARARCEQLRDLVCTRVLECLAPADRASELASCRQTWAQSVDCGAAVGISDGYPRCTRELADASCPVLLPGGRLLLPASCNGVVLVPVARAP